MPRQPRVFLEGGLYHVTNRLAHGATWLGHEGQDGQDDRAGRFVELLQEIRDRDDWTVLAWCVLPSEYHLALRVGPIPLARSMGSIQARFGQEVNRDRQTRGPLWQGRYRARLVEDAEHLPLLMAYVHLRPVTAGLADDPADHHHSGHRELMRRSRPSLVDVDRALRDLGPSPRTARQRYLRTMERVAATRWCSLQTRALPWWRHARDRPLSPDHAAAWIEHDGVFTGLERERLTAVEYLERACAALDVSLTRLAGPTRDAESSRLRVLVTGVGVERWGVRTVDLARLLHRWPDSVSRWVRQAAGRRASNDTFLEAYEQLDRAVAGS